MKPSALPVLCLTAALLLLSVSCGKKEKQADAAQPLQESFKAADSQVKQSIDVVTDRLRAKDYAAAARALEPVVTRQQLNGQEKQAVSLALQQLNQAVAANRSLDTKEMYELRAKMFRAVYHSGARF